MVRIIMLFVNKFIIRKSHFLKFCYRFSLAVNSAIASSNHGMNSSVVLLELNLALSAGGNIFHPNFGAHLEVRASGAVLLYSWDLSTFLRAH